MSDTQSKKIKNKREIDMNIQPLNQSGICPTQASPSTLEPEEAYKTFVRQGFYASLTKRFCRNAVGSLKKTKESCKQREYSKAASESKAAICYIAFTAISLLLIANEYN